MNDRLDEIKRRPDFKDMPPEDWSWLISEVERLTKRCEEARKIIESLKELDYQTAGTPNYVLEEWLEGKP